MQIKVYLGWGICILCQGINIDNLKENQIKLKQIDKKIGTECVHGRTCNTCILPLEVFVFNINFSLPFW